MRASCLSVMLVKLCSMMAGLSSSSGESDCSVCTDGVWPRFGGGGGRLGSGATRPPLVGFFFCSMVSFSTFFAISLVASSRVNHMLSSAAPSFFAAMLLTASVVLRDAASAGSMSAWLTVASASPYSWIQALRIPSGILSTHVFCGCTLVASRHASRHVSSCSRACSIVPPISGSGGQLDLLSNGRLSFWRRSSTAGVPACRPFSVSRRSVSGSGSLGPPPLKRCGAIRNDDVTCVAGNSSQVGELVLLV